MAVATIKTTYSLDAATIRTLEGLAETWKVSKSEALRRAIRLAAEHAETEPDSPVDALDALQDSLRLDSERAAAWERQARAERHAASKAIESR